MGEEPQLPFFGGFDLSQIMRMLQSEGPVNWQVARQFAHWMAVADGTDLANPLAAGAPPAEPPVSSADQDRFADLVRAAQTRVAAVTGLSESLALSTRVVTRSEWAAHHLDALRPVLEALAETLQRADDASGATDSDADAAGDADPFAGLMTMLAPVLLGVQAGSMVGSLAQHALGRYDFVLPSADAPSLLFVARNVDDFQAAWSLDRDDLRFSVAIHEVVHGALRSVRWVRELLVSLATEYVRGFVFDRDALDVALGGVDPTDPTSLGRIQGDPDALLGAISSPAQEPIRERLRRLAMALEGYADVVIEAAAESIVPSFARVQEALRRHRLDRGGAGTLVERMLGIDAGREHFELGEAWARGVTERAGIEGLDRVWEKPEHLPTPAELDAPGLWLARIELDLD